MNVRRIIRKGLPVVLTALSCAGVIGTGISSAKATEKCLFDKKENTPAWKFYIEPSLIALGTIGCIAGCHILNKKQQAALIAGQMIISQSYGKYKEKVREVYGEESAIKLEEQIAVEECKKQSLYSYVFGEESTLDVPNPEQEMLFEENIGGTIFKTTFSKVLQAEYHLNRNFVLSGGESVATFYEFLGLHYDEEMENIGWSIDDDFYWIDFGHFIQKLSNGEMGCMITCTFTPERQVDDFYIRK